MFSVDGEAMPNCEVSRVLESKKEVSSSSKKEIERKNPFSESKDSPLPRRRARVARPMPTTEEVRELLSYNPLTGCLVWRVTVSRTARAGSLAGTVTGRHGDRVVCFNRRWFPAHRLAWLIQTGEWPVSELDHVNCDKADNRWENLRIASHRQNSQNKGVQANNRSGFKGVSWSKAGKAWVAQITIDGVHKYLGLFQCKIAASAAYQAAAIESFGEFARFE
jgi:hypothetical protein